MPSIFSRTTSSIGTDRFRGSMFMLLAAVILLALWAAWFFFAEIKLYETTSSSRIEASRASHPIQAIVAGKVVKTNLELGAEVRAGDLLVELETKSLKLQLEEAKAHKEALTLLFETLHREIKVWEKGLTLARAEDVADLESLRSEVVHTIGDISAVSMNFEKIKHDIDNRRIRAIVSGTLGEIKELMPGSYVQPGDVLAVIVPPGRLGAVAYFSPANSLGRIKPGQRAQLRLYGFPWTEYGTVPAKVSTVASEALDNRVRVEFDLRPDPLSRIPLQHGLPGVMEVTVERITPAYMVLRAAGKMLNRMGANSRAADNGPGTGP